MVGQHGVQLKSVLTRKLVALENVLTRKLVALENVLTRKLVALENVLTRKLVELENVLTRKLVELENVPRVSTWSPCLALRPVPSRQVKHRSGPGEVEGMNVVGDIEGKASFGSLFKGDASLVRVFSWSWAISRAKQAPTQPAPARPLPLLSSLRPSSSFSSWMA